MADGGRMVVMAMFLSALEFMMMFLGVYQNKPRERERERGERESLCKLDFTLS